MILNNLHIKDTRSEATKQQQNLFLQLSALTRLYLMLAAQANDVTLTEIERQAHTKSASFILTRIDYMRNALKLKDTANG